MSDKSSEEPSNPNETSGPVEESLTAKTRGQYGVSVFNLDSYYSAVPVVRTDLTLLFFMRGANFEVRWQNKGDGEYRQAKIDAPCVVVLAEGVSHVIAIPRDSEIWGFAVEREYAMEVIKRPVEGLRFVSFAELNCSDLTIDVTA